MAKVKRDKLDVEHLKISDLIPVEDIQKIQDSFAYAFGCAANILNPDGTFICKGSNFYFCHQYFNRKTALGRERCRKSDEAIGREAVRSKKAVIRFCTNGHLIDGAAPVIIEGKHIATVFAGQILFEPPKEKDLEIYRKIARELGVDEEEYIESLKNVHIIPEEKFRKAVDHLVQIAATLATAAYQKLKEKRAKEEIKKREEEQARAITAFSKVLGKVATGDLSARVDTKGWSEELEVIGMAMNTLIESLEFEKHRKS